MSHGYGDFGYVRAEMVRREYAKKYYSHTYPPICGDGRDSRMKFGLDTPKFGLEAPQNISPH